MAETDVSLVWFSIEDSGDTGEPRAKVRELARKHGFPPETLTRDSKISAFTRACRVSTTYEEDGTTFTVTGQQIKRTSEFITFQVVRGDGFKLAEYKFFQSRRTRVGVVKGSHVVRSVLRAGLSARQKEAATAWLEAAGASYEQLQGGTPIASIRRLVHGTLRGAAVPILGRESMYFLYGDEVEVAYRVRGFLDEAMAVPPVVNIVDVDDFSSYQPFADSADAFLNAQADVVVKRVRNGLLDPKVVSLQRRSNWNEAIASLRTRRARHVRRLKLDLPLTEQTLLLADRLVLELPVHPACRE